MKAKGSVWDEMDDVNVDVTKLEEFFAAKPPPAKKTVTVVEKKVEKPTFVELLDSNKARSVNIMLSRFKISFSDIAQAILQLRDAFSDDQIQALNANKPSDEDIKVIKAYTGDKEKLANAEKFFTELMTVNDLNIHLEFMLARKSFPEDIEALSSQIKTIVNALKSLDESKKLKQSLEIILALGNYMNGGSMRGGAMGFKIKSLTGLTEMRGATPNVTFMHIFVYQLLDNKKELDMFPNELPDVTPASKLDFEFIKSQFKDMQTAMNKFTRTKEKAESHIEEGDLFAPKFTEFNNVAGPKLVEIKNSIDNIEKLYDTVLKKYSEERATYPLADLLGLFSKFFVDYCTTRDEIIKQREKEEKELAKKKAEEEKKRLEEEAKQPKVEEEVQEGEYQQQRGCLDAELSKLAEISVPTQEVVKKTRARSARIRSLLNKSSV